MAKPDKPNKKTKATAKRAVAAAKRRGRKGVKPKPRSKRRKPGKDASDPPAPKNSPKGKRITNAEKSVRDTLIVERVALGWGWKEIAAEAGLSVEQTKRNYRARIKLLPQLLEMDPMKIIELLVQGFQNSIIDFETMAKDYSERNPSAAVGAKKASVEARKDLAQLLQATGQLPHELGTLRHLVDIRVTVRALIGHVDKFSDRVRSIELPDGKRAEVLDAAGELKGGLRELAGEDEPPAEAKAA